MSFAIAKDMSWFDVDTLAILNHFNGKCSLSTINSNFTVGNEACKAKLAEQYQQEAAMGPSTIYTPQEVEAFIQ